MSWQSDLHRYMELGNEIVALESRESKECSCDSSKFHRCPLHDEIANRWIEQLRLMDLWGRLWALKLYRVAQGMELATPVHFAAQPKEEPVGRKWMQKIAKEAANGHS